MLVVYRHIVTSGSSGEVRIFKGFEDDDPITYTVCQSVLAIAVQVTLALMIIQ